MYCVYMLRLLIPHKKYGKYYVGVSNNAFYRIARHILGEGSIATDLRGVAEIVRHRFFSSKEAALDAEREIQYDLYKQGKDLIVEEDCASYISVANLLRLGTYNNKIVTEFADKIMANLVWK